MSIGATALLPVFASMWYGRKHGINQRNILEMPHAAIQIITAGKPGNKKAAPCR